MKSGGTPYKTGEILKQYQLAKYILLISERGAEVFYKYSIAKDIVENLQTHGGITNIIRFSES